MEKLKHRFDISGHEKYYEYMARYFYMKMLATGENMLTFMERWGELMENKMKQGPLTIDVINRTCEQVLKVNDVSDETLEELFDTMTTVWVHGQKMSDLAPNRGTSDFTALYRVMTNNKAYDFLANYPNDPNKIDTSTKAGRRNENIRILSTLVPNTKLIDTFEKYAITSEDRCNYFVQSTCVPKEEFFGTAEYAFNFDVSDPNWRNEIKAVCDGAKKRVVELQKNNNKNSSAEM